MRAQPEPVWAARSVIRLALTVIAGALLLGLPGGIEPVGAIEGREATYEWAVDAPWRMEPTMVPCSGAMCPSYGPIPIQIAIHDSDLNDVDPSYAAGGNANVPCPLIGPDASCAYSIRRLGQIKSVVVTELPSRASRTYTVGDAHEVEFTTGHWRVSGAAPAHTTCRRWAGDNCARFNQVAGTSEWHATLIHTPLSRAAAGADLRLKVEVRVGQVNLASTGSLPDTSLTQHLSVHFGEAPLPRFDPNWAYGDLHYHAEGTDNEGESAYSHRGVLHAMSALGLDFAFATEHASGGLQYTAISEFPIDFSSEDVLRDSNRLRFETLLARLNAPRGANSDVASSFLAGRPARRIPQLFLGDEVDVIPETTVGQYAIPYGNGLKYSVDSCAYDLPIGVSIAGGEGGCSPGDFRLLVHDFGDGRWGIKDLQGPASRKYFARQHLLHLPFDPARGDAFVRSATSKFGGATRRLRDVLSQDFDAGAKGVLFLAHPLNHAEGTGHGRMAGPDLVPYSDVQLDEAFASPHVLGLQLWNEDERMDSDRAVTRQPGIQGEVNPFKNLSVPTWGSRPPVPKLVNMLQHSTFTWDKLLRKGISESDIRALRWLPAGQPRRVLMAGGSDGHGDLNYRRVGQMNEEISSIADTAMGKPRNLLFAGTARGVSTVPGAGTAPFSQQQIVEALRQGQFTVTDGPALRIAWDVNRNNVIDPPDVPMGGQLDLDGGSAQLLVEWLSTQEFGNVDHIDLYIGVRNEEIGVEGTYAPESHGVLQLDTTDKYPARLAAGPGFRSFRDSNTGRRIARLADGYWFAQDGPWLRISAKSLAGTRPVAIDLDQFPVGIMNESTGTFERNRRADRLYVRAVAVTTRGCDVAARSECLERFAFTNPVWARARFTPIVGTGGKCLEVREGSTANGAPLVMGTCNRGTPGQRFTWDPRTQEIAGLGWDKRVDLLGGNPDEGAVVGMWYRTGGAMQKWAFANAEIRLVGGFVIEVETTGSFEGADVRVGGSTGAANQRWTLLPSGEIRGDGRCLDVYAWGTAEGTPVRMYTCHGGTNQKWSLEPNGRIRGFGGNCLGVDRPGGVPTGRLTMRSCNASFTAGWELFGEIRGLGGKCLDVYGSRTADGTPVLAYTCHGGANQKWHYRP